MKTFGTMVWRLFRLVVLGVAGWLLGLREVIQALVRLIGQAGGGSVAPPA
jgi:hypothetical protein